MKPELSGFVCVRNARELDYCIEECVESLVPVCDELIISDGESTDGTLDTLRWLMAKHPKIRVVTYRWDNPHRDIGWWVRWLNAAREQCSHKTIITLDADEVLDPASYSQIRKLVGTGRSAFFQRLNFWKDPQHLAPYNRVCGEMVARMGPASLYVPSDEPEPAVHPNLRTRAEEFSSLRIFHYGFLRKPDAFVRKSHVVQNAFFGSMDSRLTEMQEKGKRWDERDYFDKEPLRRFNDEHPEVALAWLKERGYDTP